MQSRPEIPQTVYATIVLALIFSVFCFLVGLGLVVLNLNNPVWDTRVRVIMIVGTALFLGLILFLGKFLRRKPD